jgi:hypothetical protein
MSLADIPSVRYLKIEKTANSPKAAPVLNSTLFNMKETKKIMLLNEKKVRKRSLLL